MGNSEPEVMMWIFFEEGLGYCGEERIAWWATNDVDYVFSFKRNKHWDGKSDGDVARRRSFGSGDGFPARRILNLVGQAAFLDLREGDTCPL
jgi:hypothetical protein